MDKTIQIVVVVMLLLITSVAVMAIFGARLGPFSNTIGNQTGKASCSIAETDFRNSCTCESPEPDPEDFADPNECEWVNNLDCSDVCSG